MHLTQLTASSSTAIADLFYEAFQHSEGDAEGVLIRQLAESLTELLPSENVVCFGTEHQNQLVASIFFSRLSFDAQMDVFMLSPVAVKPSDQRQGLGQALIRHGMAFLTRQGVDAVVTYGDPAYYQRVGFEPIDESLIPAPMPLSMPFGWLGQSLNGRSLVPRSGRPHCVPPFRDAVYW